jgi:ribosome biogenesis GTPase
MAWWDEADEDEGLDESDVRIRPNPRGSRPRTKRRPGHPDATAGFVIAVDRGRFTVLVDENTPEERRVQATRGSVTRLDRVVTGDIVELVGDLSGRAGSLARIVGVRPRSTLLRRSADDTDRVERIIVANADQMLIVVAASHPEPRVRLVDRLLVAAYDAGIVPMLCITKTDEADPAPFAAQFAGLTLPIITSRLDAVPVERLTRMLSGHRTVLVGHSGVGKSTLINALVPGAERAIGTVNTVTGRGRHTSSSTRALRVPGTPPGWVIDTPGVRSFGLGHVEPEHVLSAFDDLAALAQQCPRGCGHAPDAPDCALNKAARAGILAPSAVARLDSVRRLFTATTSGPGE